MLAGMLLHVVETARPVHLPKAVGPGEVVKRWAIRLPFIHDIGDLDTSQAAAVEGLTSGGGIKRCPIQVDPPAVVYPLDD